MKISARGAILLFVFFCAVYFLTAGGHFYNQDGYFKYLTLDQIVKQEGPFHPRFFTPGRDGRLTTSFPPGTSLWMLPLYAAGNAVLESMRRFVPRVQVDASLFFAPFFVTFLNVFFTAGICVFFAKVLCCMGLSRGRALVMTACLGFGTVLWPYSKFCYSEPQAAFFLMACFYELLSLRHFSAGEKMLRASLWFSAAVLTKYEVFFLLPAFLLYAWLRLSDESRNLRGRILAAAAAPLAVSAVILWGWNFLCFGSGFSWGRYGGYLLSNPAALGAGAGFALLAFGAGLASKKISPASAPKKTAVFAAAFALGCIYLSVTPAAQREFYAAFFAPGKSLFVFSPVLLLALAGYPAFFRCYKKEAVFSAALLFSYLLLLPPTLHSAAWQWSSRFLVPLVPFLFLPALTLFQAGTVGRFRLVFLGFVMALSLAIQLLSVSVSYVDTFNYTSQKISQDFGRPLDDFEAERKAVFPKILYDWRYAPLRMQWTVLRALLTKKYPPVPRETLAFKSHVKRPEDWKWDFWWVYLWHRPGGEAAVRTAAALLAVLGLLSGAALLREIAKEEAAC